MTASELCRDRNSVGTDIPLMSMHTGELVTWMGEPRQGGVADIGKGRGTETEKGN